jgi:SAM-dependent methyltransferase
MSQFNDPALADQCKKEFNLSYHIDYAFECARTISFAGKDVLEVGGSLPPKLVFDILGAKSWTALETPDYEQELSEADGLTHQGTLLHKDTSIVPIKGYGTPLSAPYNFFLTTIEDLPEAHHEKYDLVFSIATFEHIQKLPLALDRMYKSLKPGGKLFSLFAPVWSAYDGHHMPGITDASGKPVDRSMIPPWGHLLMRPAEMLKHLCTKTDFDTAALMVFYIYQSPFLNRFFTEDYVGFITQTRFKISHLEGIFMSQPLPELLSKLSQLYPGRAHFANNGVYVRLEK